jgi:FtsP/CotA-like multicopper oxidase with cupredoxin domain
LGPRHRATNAPFQRDHACRTDFVVTGSKQRKVTPLARPKIVICTALSSADSNDIQLSSRTAPWPFALQDLFLPFAVLLLALLAPVAASASPRSSTSLCQRPAAGSDVPEPEDLRSQNGTLKVDLTFHNFMEADGEIGYCYLYKDGAEAPTLRLKPGDWLIVSLKNDLKSLHATNGVPPSYIPPMSMEMSSSPASCGGGTPMSATATNLHFHGLTVRSTCHQDDVMQTAIDPSSGAFEYKFQIPADEPPGLYWYHPHIHGFTKTQVLGGASGALIIEGLERAEPDASGIPERVLVIRDQDLLNPNAAPLDAGPKPPPVLLDSDGDTRNTGSGTGKPAKDLSINFVPVSYPDYRPAIIRMKPLERQLWRVVNASAITYLNLQLVYNGAAQPLEIIAMDGVPLNENRLPATGVVWEDHAGLPPGGRAEFIVKGPAEGAVASILTRSVNTGPGGENDPVRPLAAILASPTAAEPRAILSTDSTPLPKPSLSWVGAVQPVRTRRLYFSEVLSDPNNPNSPTTFMLTVDGQEPKPFDPNSNIPNIVTHQGEVEDWIIENRTQELHAFHIHQIHFVLMEWFGIPVSEPFLRDTINVPFWDGKSLAYPSVRLRMDFRDPNSVGTFIYHCHLLEHEDGGMMGTIQVLPRRGGQAPAEDQSHATPAEAKHVSSLIAPRKQRVLCGEHRSTSAKSGF